MPEGRVLLKPDLLLHRALGFHPGFLWKTTKRRRVPHLHPLHDDVYGAFRAVNCSDEVGIGPVGVVVGALGQRAQLVETWGKPPVEDNGECTRESVKTSATQGCVQVASGRFKVSFAGSLQESQDGASGRITAQGIRGRRRLRRNRSCARKLEPRRWTQIRRRLGGRTEQNVRSSSATSVVKRRLRL